MLAAWDAALLNDPPVPPSTAETTSESSGGGTFGGPGGGAFAALVGISLALGEAVKFGSSVMCGGRDFVRGEAGDFGTKVTRGEASSDLELGT